MKFRAARILQFAVLVLIAAVGLAGVLVCIQSPYALLAIVGLMALGFAAVGLGEARQDGADRGPEAAQQNLEARVRRLDGELATIASLIEAHLEASGRFTDSLARAAKSLPTAVDPDQVRAVVRRLIQANEQMQRDTSELSERLEKSRAQVAALRSKLVEAQAMGLRDSLTSLANRRSFDDNLAKEIDEARLRGAPMCLVLGDVDHFKKINDSFGHPFGDMVLKFFAELVSKLIKQTDMAARIGGEEFAIVLPGAAPAEAARLVEEIRRRLESQQWMNAQSGKLFSKITASFGIVRLRDSDDHDSLLRRADAMLYEAKRAGRNRIVLEPALDDADAGAEARSAS